MERNAERQERARELAHESYGGAGFYPDDYEAVVGVFVRRLHEHDGDEASARTAALNEIDNRICELAEDDPYWAEFAGWTEPAPAA